jgi:hypothetical protein
MTHEKDDATESRQEKYKHLPPPVHIEDTITSQETVPARDPKGGRDDQEFINQHWGF